MRIDVLYAAPYALDHVDLHIDTRFRLAVPGHRDEVDGLCLPNCSDALTYRRAQVELALMDDYVRSPGDLLVGSIGDAGFDVEHLARGRFARRCWDVDRETALGIGMAGAAGNLVAFGSIAKPLRRIV